MPSYSPYTYERQFRLKFFMETFGGLEKLWAFAL